jgi:hypothetical protein
MLVAVVALTVTSAAAADVPVSIASPGFTGVEVKSEMLNFLNDHFSQQLEAQGVRVMTPKEITALIGLERQRQMAGCGDEACSVELAGALGVDALISATVARIGSTYFQVSVKALSSSGTVLASFSDKATSEEGLVELLTKAAPIMAGDVLRALNRKPVLVGSGLRSVSISPLKKFSFIPALVGLAAVGVGTGLYFMAKNNYQLLVAGPAASKLSDPVSTANTGKLEQSLAVALWAGGGACIAVAALMFGLGSRSPLAASIAPVPGGGGGFVLSGALP